MGLVASGFTGQAPARQAALMGGLPLSTPCTAVNKVCASGMKAIMLASQSIALGHQDVICAGGMESMSNIPFYLPRRMPTYGGATLYDGLVHDGLTDAKLQIHMGLCGEKTASDLKISRSQQDDYARMSYERSQAAAAQGVFASEIVPVRIPNKTSPNGFDEVHEDEEYKKGGTITAANASSLNDGAAAAILSSAAFASKDRSLKPLARIVAFADAAVQTVDFPVAPELAVDKLLQLTGVKKENIDLWEINEAFSVVALANIKLLGLDVNKVNVHGGAVSCGHPLGYVTLHLSHPPVA
ncbi:hypothetical protein AHF37_05122 [Paragonimus kellicotti]|nr:hypothetical protein AHF37_05122 [Paragonimus kellicotti]